MPREPKQKVKREKVLGAQYCHSGYGYNESKQRAYLDTITDPDYPYDLYDYEIEEALEEIEWYKKMDGFIPENWQRFKIKHRQPRGYYFDILHRSNPRTENSSKAISESGTRLKPAELSHRDFEETKEFLLQEKRYDGIFETLYRKSGKEDNGYFLFKADDGSTIRIGNDKYFGFIRKGDQKVTRRFQDKYQNKLEVILEKGTVSSVSINEIPLRDGNMVSITPDGKMGIHTNVSDIEDGQTLYINGIRNTAMDAIGGAFYIKEKIEKHLKQNRPSPILLVYNESDISSGGTGAQDIKNAMALQDNPATDVEPSKDTILNLILAGKVDTVFAHSQGALISGSAMVMAERANGKDKLREIAWITIGGAHTENNIPTLLYNAYLYENVGDPVPYADQKDLERIPPGYRHEMKRVYITLPGMPPFDTGFSFPETREFVSPEWNHKKKVEFINRLRSMGKDYQLITGECKTCNVFDPIDDHLLTEGAYDWIFEDLSQRIEKRAKEEKEHNDEK